MSWKSDFGKCVPWNAKNHFTGPVSVLVECSYRMPAKTSSGPPVGDVDNLAKGVMDAMQEVGVFPNDRLVVELTCRKGYGAEDCIKVRVSDA